MDEVDDVPEPWDWHRVFRLTACKLLNIFERHLFYPGLYRTRDRKIHECLFGNNALPLLPDTIAIPSTLLNDPSTGDLLRLLETDVLVVCGLPLLKPHIFQVPKIATINVHLGLAPKYRGIHTVFWPLFKRDYENIGVTIHRIDTGVDTGPIVAHGLPAIEPNDCEASLLSKMAVLAGDALTAYLHNPTDKLLPQEQLGPQEPLYLYRHRRIWHDLALSLRRRFANENCRVLPDRTVYYFMSPKNDTVSPTHPIAGEKQPSPQAAGH